ncbi:MAG: hypothetical protein ACK5DM_16450, partial [Planctomyces sp.]
LNARIQEGHPEDALEAIRIIAEGPPEGSDYSSDVLQRMSQVGTRLASEGAGRLCSITLASRPHWINAWVGETNAQLP